VAGSLTRQTLGTVSMRFTSRNPNVRLACSVHSMPLLREYLAEFLQRHVRRRSVHRPHFAVSRATAVVRFAHGGAQ